MTDRPVIVSRGNRVTVSIVGASMLLCCASLLSPMAGHAAATPVAFSESAPAFSGKRAFQVTVGQVEINAPITSAAGLGVLGGAAGIAIGLAVDSPRAKARENVVGDIRDSLLDFDADSLAVQSTQTALSKVDWLQAEDIKFSRDFSQTGRGEFVDSTDAEQFAFFNYGYELTSDLTAANVTVTIEFCDKYPEEKRKKPLTLMTACNMVYQQSITSSISLPTPAKDTATRAELWSAGNGKLAREALNLAFDNAAKMIPRVLTISEADYNSMKGQEGLRLDPTDSKSASFSVLKKSGIVIKDTLPQNSEDNHVE